MLVIYSITQESEPLLFMEGIIFARFCPRFGVVTAPNTLLSPANCFNHRSRLFFPSVRTSSISTCSKVQEVRTSESKHVHHRPYVQQQVRAVGTTVFLGVNLQHQLKQQTTYGGYIRAQVGTTVGAVGAHVHQQIHEQQVGSEDSSRYVRTAVGMYVQQQVRTYSSCFFFVQYVYVHQQQVHAVGAHRMQMQQVPIPQHCIIHFF